MSFNYNMGGMNNGMSGMGMMGMMGGMSGMGMNTSGNVWQYYTAKYGCEDCFMHEPSWFEMHSKVMKADKERVKPNFWQRLCTRLGC